MRRLSLARRNLDRPADHRFSRAQALGDKRRHGLGVRQHLAVRAPFLRRVPEAQQPAADRVHDLNAAGVVDHQQAGAEAGDDLVGDELGGLRARRHRALLRLELRHGFRERGGQERRLHAALARPASRLTCGRHEAQHRERQHRDEDRHDRGQPEKRLALWCHRVIEVERRTSP
jgi:hypothetical protein